MKKIILIISIFGLILITALVKNSTKKIEDKIFVTKNNIRSLKTALGDVLLEYNYLSSPEKLFEHQKKYFENELVQIDITKIKKITEVNNQLQITDFIKKDLK